jgi:putative lumazine-binding protein
MRCVKRRKAEFNRKRDDVKKIIFLIISAFLLNGAVIAQTTSPDESAAITKTALDYIQGWYPGDATRMERALHRELAKRMISTDPKTRRSQFNHMEAMALVQHTRDGGGKKTPQIDN